MKRKILDFSVMKEEISQDNVLKMAELIAFMELRFQIGYLWEAVRRKCMPHLRYHKIMYYSMDSIIDSMVAISESSNNSLCSA